MINDLGTAVPAPPQREVDLSARLADVSGRVYDMLHTAGIAGYLVPDEALTWVLRDMRALWASGRGGSDASAPADAAMSLRLAWRSRSEAVDLEASGDADDAGSIFAGGEVSGLLGGPWAGPVGAVADEEARVEDLEQERGQGQVKILRGKSPP